ncbi:hypothetical protein [Microbulbifer sp. ALW1]|uniref:alginate O-acetyltransferase AlgX-related protein n=1 Tax=Microbulbifer sp. (strain ALW1) TaxID=1516059 RepID=UPI00135C54F1|nr:hypothetical protein [Microbulbifer sp. ALW1]
MFKKEAFANTQIFIALFFLIGIYAPLFIWAIEEDKDKSTTENRTLEQLPEPPSSARELATWPQSFSNYYSDQFGFRDWLSQKFNSTKSLIGDSPSEHVTKGKNGWLFLGSNKIGYSGYDDPIGDARNKNLYSSAELEAFSEYASSLSNWLKTKKVEYIFFIAPNKHTIYPEELPSHFNKVNSISAADQLYDFLGKNSSVRTIDFRSALLQEKEGHDVYYKSDTHWNHYAANLVQFELASYISNLFPGKISPELFDLELKTKSGGDLSKIAGLNVPDDPYPLPIFNSTCAPQKSPQNASQRETHSYLCETEKLKVLVFRDSFFTALEPYFARKFYASTFIWERLDPSTIESLVEKYEPDVIIEEWVERKLPHTPRAGEFLSKELFQNKFLQSNNLIFNSDFRSTTLRNATKIDTGDVSILNIESQNTDPQIIIKNLKFSSDKQHILKVEMLSPENSKLQVFYSLKSNPKHPFTQQQSIIKKVNAGNNTIYVKLPKSDLDHILRIDPTSTIGKISIKSISIKAIN